MKASVLFVAAVLVAACDPGLGADAKIQEARVDKLVIDWTRPDARSLHGSSMPITICDHMPGGVVSSWQLDEINRYDFRASILFCTDMDGRGQLTGHTDWIEHFRYVGSATTLATVVPAGMLPVGLRVREKAKSGSPTGYKVSDVALLVQSPADVEARFHGYSQAGWATGRSAGSITDMRCGPGTVVTGVSVAQNEDAGGPNRSEIVDIYIRCNAIERVPLDPSQDDIPTETDAPWQ